MKKLIALLSLIALPLMAATPEFTAGVDPTGYSSISGALLKQMIDYAKPATGRGLVIVQATTPDTATYGYLTNYLWLDTSGTTAAAKIWSGSAWVATSVAVGAVGNAQIAGSAITSDKIRALQINTTNLNDLAVNNDKIAGDAVTETKIAGNAVSRRTMALGAVDSTILTNGAVATANIADLAVTWPKMANDSVATANLTNGAVTSAKIANYAVMSNNIATNAVSPYNLKKIDYGYCSSDGTFLTKSAGINDITKSGTGIYRINFASNKTGTNYIVTATPWGGGYQYCATVSNLVGSVTVIIYDSSTSLLDKGFGVTIIDPQ